MKWLAFIALVLIESLAIFGLSLEQIGFTVPQAILISVYAALLIITITVFIIAHFVNLQKERENEFRILIRELREIKEVVGTSETRVIKLESLIENDVRNDIEKVYKCNERIETKRIISCGGIISTFIFIIFTIRISNFGQIISL